MQWCTFTAKFTEWTLQQFKENWVLFILALTPITWHHDVSSPNVRFTKRQKSLLVVKSCTIYYSYNILWGPTSDNSAAFCSTTCSVHGVHSVSVMEHLIICSPPASVWASPECYPGITSDSTSINWITFEFSAEILCRVYFHDQV